MATINGLFKIKVPYSEYNVSVYVPNPWIDWNHMDKAPNVWVQCTSNAFSSLLSDPVYSAFFVLEYLKYDDVGVVWTPNNADMSEADLSEAPAVLYLKHMVFITLYQYVSGGGLDGWCSLYAWG